MSGNPEHACIYTPAHRNCVDFVQEVFTAAGGAGDFVDYFSDEQLGYGYLFSPFLGAHIAMDYGYIRSRGISQYIRGGFIQKADQIYQTIRTTLGMETTSTPPLSLSHRMISIHEAMSPKESAIAQRQTAEGEFPSISLNTSSLPALSENLQLVSVIGKMAYDCFNGIRGLYQRGVGEKATRSDAEELAKWGREGINSSFEDLDRVSPVINVDLETLEEDEIERNRLLNKKWLGLTFNGIHLEEELKKLKKCRSLPTKKYLEDIKNRLFAHTTSCKNLVSIYYPNEESHLTGTRA